MQIENLFIFLDMKFSLVNEFLTMIIIYNNYFSKISK